MVRDRRLAIRQFPEGVQEDLDEEADEEAAGDGDFDDLVVEADPEEFDRTFRITSDLEPFAGGEAPSIPRPWQGLPRVAIVYNLNYVWDDTAEEWVKQHPFSGGGGGAYTLIDTGTFTVPDSSGAPNFPFNTGVSTFHEGAIGEVGFADSSDLTAGQVNFNIEDNSSGAGDVLTYQFGFDPGVPEYLFDIQHEFGNDVDVRWAIVQPNF